MASSSTFSAAPPMRPILRKKKSVTFHPSTKPSSPRPDSSSLTESFPPFSPTKAAAAANGGAAGAGGLLPFSALAPWQADNAFIRSAYRAPAGSHRAALPSLFALHNETCNVWTHLAGLVGLGAFGAWFLAVGLEAGYPAHTPGDRAAFVAFFAGACGMLAASAAYHLFADVSEGVGRAWNGVDYAGIVACVWGSFVACLHFGFPDDAKVEEVGEGGGGLRVEGGVDLGRGRRRAYETMISALAVVCTVVSVLPRFRTPDWRPFRASMFVAMGLSAAFPVLHGLAIYGREQMERQMSVSWVVAEGVFYVVGAALYAARIPERFAPGKFDLFGASHQIFHVLVVLAAGTHLVGLLKALDYACSQR